MSNTLKNHYSFWSKVQLLYWLIKTKIICPKARLFRFPFILRGKKYIDFGRNLTTGVGCRLEAFQVNNSPHKRIVFGKNVQLNDYVHISAMQGVEIGDNVLIASHVYISDNSHGVYQGTASHTSPEIPPIKRPYFIGSVKILDNVWLGEGVIVLPNVQIGKGSVIGAHSVVNQDIPPYCIAVGAPAKVVKKYSFESSRWERV